MATTCTGPAVDEDGREARCDRDAKAEGLCMSHYQQAIRCRNNDEPVILKPLRPRIGQPKMLIRTRVKAFCSRELQAEAESRPKSTLAEVAREVLEDYARRRLSERTNRKHKK